MLIGRVPGDAECVVGAVDVGATSVHLLVASVEGGTLRPLADESVFLGLGDAVDAKGFLGTAARTELAAALIRYAEAARSLGATRIAFVGTEPIRRAGDAPRIVDVIGRASGLPLHVLEHWEEGYLTLLAVTEGRPVEGELLVVDLGGGSSEFVIVAPHRRPIAVGLRLGAAALTARHVRHDPPTLDELDAVANEARSILGVLPPSTPSELVAVGGTASNLLRVLPASSADRSLSRAAIREVLGILRSMTAAAAVERHGIRPVRARILPAGAVILDAVLERSGLDRLRVSEAGIREGVAIALALAGEGWRDRLAVLTRGSAA